MSKEIDTNKIAIPYDSYTQLINGLLEYDVEKITSIVFKWPDSDSCKSIIKTLNFINDQKVKDPN